MVVYGIASQENADTVRSYTSALGLTYPILLDTTGSVKRAYEQEMPFPTGAYPQDWIVGTDGRVVYQNNRWDLQAMEAAIEAELAE